MALTDTIIQSLGGDAMQEIGTLLGTDAQQARDVTGATIAALLGGMARNAAGDEGAQALLGAVRRDHDGWALDRASAIVGGERPAEGAAILRHVFGGKRPGVEQAIGRSFDVSDGGVADLMARLAPLVMGALGRETRREGLDAGGLSRLLGQETSRLAEAYPQGMQLLGALLDADGDGDVDLGDLVRKGSGLLGKLLR